MEKNYETEATVSKKDWVNLTMIPKKDSGQFLIVWVYLNPIVSEQLGKWER